MIDVEVRKFKDFKLEGATVIQGFPGVGLVGTIVANYLIGVLDLDQICAIDSPYFPPISMIYARKPKFPARIYASEKLKLAVFLSEFTPPPTLARPIANTMLSYAKQNKCHRIIAAEAVKVEKTQSGKEFSVYAIGSTDHAREEIESAQIEQMGSGIVSGVSGILLNEGRWLNFDVVCLIAETPPDVPAVRAVAKIIDSIDRLLPQIKIDVKPLYKEAEKIEERVKNLRAHVTPKEPEVMPEMYA